MPWISSNEMEKQKRALKLAAKAIDVLETKISKLESELFAYEMREIGTAWRATLDRIKTEISGNGEGSLGDSGITEVMWNGKQK